MSLIRLQEMALIPVLVYTTFLLPVHSSTSITAIVTPSPSLALGASSNQIEATPASPTGSLADSPGSNQPSSVAFVGSMGSNQSSSAAPSPTATDQTVKPTDVFPASSSLGVSASVSVGVHPCEKNNGGCAHNCTRNGSEYNCTCGAGFKLDSDGHKCTDINECNSTTHGNNCEHICVNTLASYACACRTGYKLETDGLACKEDSKPSPTGKMASEQQLDWVVLGIVIGVMILAIVILVIGVISKRVVSSRKKQENSGVQEMTAVRTTPHPMAAINPVATES